MKLSNAGECVATKVIAEEMERPIYVMHGFHASKFECVNGDTWDEICEYLTSYFSFLVTLDDVELQPSEILVKSSIYGHWEIHFRYVLDEELLTPGSHELRGVWASSGEDCDCLNVNVPLPEGACVDGIVEHEEVCTTTLIVPDPK